MGGRNNCMVPFKQMQIDHMGCQGVDPADRVVVCALEATRNITAASDAKAVNKTCKATRHVYEGGSVQCKARTTDRGISVTAEKSKLLTCLGVAGGSQVHQQRRT